MKWRLQEGRGEAVYQIGVEDNGMLVGLSEEEMRESLKTLHMLAEKWVQEISNFLFIQFLYDYHCLTFSYSVNDSISPLIQIYKTK